MTFLDEVLASVEANVGEVFESEEVTRTWGGKELTFIVNAKPQSVKNKIVTYLAQGKTKVLKDPFKFDFMCIQAYVTDKAGNPLFAELSEDNRTKLCQFPPELVEDLHSIALRLNGFTKEDKEELENF